MLVKMKAIIRSNKVCVLATVAGEAPHCSLMSYAPDEECRELYMMTGRDTKKFDNMQKNSAVSLLIDTRTETGGEKLSDVHALTVAGTFLRIDDPVRRGQVMEKLTKIHPHLADLSKQEEVEVFAVRIRSCQLLHGVADALFASME